MLDFLNNVKDKDPVKTNLIEIILCYPCVHAMALYRIANLLYKINIPIIPRFLSNVASILTGIEIHPAATIGKRFFIDHGTGVVIGETAIIGDDVVIYHGVTLGGKDKFSNKKRHPTVGNNVIIGAGAKLIGDITIGDEAKIGPNSVIIKDVDPGKIIVAQASKEISKKDYEIEYFI
jgi:serine O-acetyltransferase